MFTREQAEQYYQRFPEAREAYIKEQATNPTMVPINAYAYIHSMRNPYFNQPNTSMFGPERVPTQQEQNKSMVPMWNDQWGAFGETKRNALSLYEQKAKELLANDWEYFQPNQLGSQVQTPQGVMSAEQYLQNKYGSTKWQDVVTSKFGMPAEPVYGGFSTPTDVQSKGYQDFLTQLQGWQYGQGSVGQNNASPSPSTAPTSPPQGMLASPLPAQAPTPPAPSTGLPQGSFGNASSVGGGGVPTNQPPMGMMRYPTVEDSSAWRAAPTALTTVQRGMFQ